MLCFILTYGNMKTALLIFCLQSFAVGTCWTRINGELVVSEMPLWPLPVVAQEVPPPTFSPALATPTNFQATVTKQWLILTWKANPGIDTFDIYAKDTNGVTVTARSFIKSAKELHKVSFDWRTERPTQVTIYSVASVVGGLVSKPSQEIKCQP